MYHNHLPELCLPIILFAIKVHRFDIDKSLIRPKHFFVTRLYFSLYKGAFFNYVNIILACFDTLPVSRVDICEGIPLLL